MNPTTSSLLTFAIFASLLIQASATANETSFMALNGVSAVSLEVNGVRRDFKQFGVTTESIVAHTRRLLSEGGIEILDDELRNTDSSAGILRIKISSNENQYRFYHYGISVALQRKIPLDNSAGGYISGTAWKQGRTGIVMPTDLRKLHGVIGELLGLFVRDYHAQNGAQVSLTK